MIPNLDSKTGATYFYLTASINYSFLRLASVTSTSIAMLKGSLAIGEESNSVIISSCFESYICLVSDELGYSASSSELVSTFIKPVLNFPIITFGFYIDGLFSSKSSATLLSSLSTLSPWLYIILMLVLLLNLTLWDLFMLEFETNLSYV